jgi:hypothetical protein
METAIRCDDAWLLDELCRPYEACPGSGRDPDLVIEYTVDTSVDPELYRTRRAELLPAIGEDAIARFRGPRERFAIDVALRLGLSVIVTRVRGLILHAAGAIGPRGALLFTGPSGAGKSTIFGLLEKSGAFPELLADELLFLRRESDGWRAYATPFGGESRVPAGASAPVGGIYLLSKSHRHRALPISPSAALLGLLPQARVASPREALEVAFALCAEVPCYTLEFAKDPGVVRALEEL